MGETHTRSARAAHAVMLLGPAGWKAALKVKSMGEAEQSLAALWATDLW